MHKIAVCLLISLAIVTSNTHADDDAGEVAYKKKDYATAIKEWELLASKGNTSAQYSLGFMYREGLGVQKNNAEAIKWYSMVAAKGIAVAEFNVGYLYLDDSWDIYI